VVEASNIDIKKKRGGGKREVGMIISSPHDRCYCCEPQRGLSDLEKEVQKNAEKFGVECSRRKEGIGQADSDRKMKLREKNRFFSQSTIRLRLGTTP